MAEAALLKQGGLDAETVGALLEVSAAITGELDQQRVAQLVVDRSAELVGADAARLWLWDSDTEVLRVLARSDACLLDGAEERTELGDSVIGQVFRLRQPVLVDDYEHWEFARPSLIESGVRSAMGMPLSINDQPVGVVVLHNYERRTFTGQQVALMRLFAGQAAPAFEACRLYAESETRRCRAEEAEGQVRAFNAELEQRVHQRTAELEAANGELEAFCYSVSHDLRAPLRSIDGFCQLLLEDFGDRLPDEGQGYLRRVRAASQRMASLIDDLLTLSRITRTEMRRERVDLSQMARSIVSDLKTANPGRNVSVAITDGLEAHGDPRLLRIAMENLLGNAWKFTAKHATAHIEFGAAQDGDAPAFFVRDDGAGFDMAYTDKLFGPFQRLHGMKEFDGNGIGLATVQRIINRHGGKVRAEGEVERGACFFFSL